MELNPIVALIGGLLGIAGLLGAALAVFRTSLTKGTLDLHRRNNLALQERVRLLEQEIYHFETREAKLEEKVASLRDERAVLKNLATGAAEVERLRHDLEERLQQVLSLLTKLTEERREPPS